MNDAAGSTPPLRIRTVTAGVSLASKDDLESLRAAFHFARAAGQKYEEAGYEVQTLRVATQPAGEYLGGWRDRGSLDAIRRFDEMADEAGCVLSLGPLDVDCGAAEFSESVAALLAATSNTSVSVTTADHRGLRPASICAAARTIRAIALATPGGEGNFRFAAAANVPAGTPFFPVALHAGEAAFGVGCESPVALAQALDAAVEGDEIRTVLREALETRLAPVDTLAESLAREHGRTFNGIDTSLAPGLDASIGAVVERISGRPFGASGTLAACALLTDVLRSLRQRSCGYRGLMLPVLEDLVLAQRASEGLFEVRDLLLFSSVCGTGLDVIPVPGDVSVAILEGVVRDVSALSNKLVKPLAVRLFPIPGRSPGDRVEFENPYLASANVMNLS